MHAYYREALHLSECEAYLRIAAARVSRSHPVILEMLGDGRLHLSGIERLAPHLTDSNRDALLRRATHKSKRDIERIVAEIAPQPDIPTTVRRLAVPRAVSPLIPEPIPQGAPEMSKSQTGPTLHSARRAGVRSPPRIRTRR